MVWTERRAVFLEDDFSETPDICREDIQFDLILNDGYKY